MSGEPDGSLGDTLAVQASEVRQSFSEFIDECWRQGRRVAIKRNGKPVAALVSIADLKSLLEADRHQSEAMLRKILDGTAGEERPAEVAESGDDKERLNEAAGEVIAVATRMIVPIAIKTVCAAMDKAQKGRESGRELPQESELAERVIAEFETSP
jgi:prevent-host-death family protein